MREYTYWNLNNLETHLFLCSLWKMFYERNHDKKNRCLSKIVKAGPQISAKEKFKENLYFLLCHVSPFLPSADVWGSGSKWKAEIRDSRLRLDCMHCLSHKAATLITMCHHTEENTKWLNVGFKWRGSTSRFSQTFDLPLSQACIFLYFSHLHYGGHLNDIFLLISLRNCMTLLFAKR